MGQEWWGVIGVTLSYIASFLGLLLAWRTYKRRQREKTEQPVQNGPEGGQA